MPCDGGHAPVVVHEFVLEVLVRGEEGAEHNPSPVSLVNVRASTGVGISGVARTGVEEAIEQRDGDEEELATESLIGYAQQELFQETDDVAVARGDDATGGIIEAVDAAQRGRRWRRALVSKRRRCQWRVLASKRCRFAI